MSVTTSVPMVAVRATHIGEYVFVRAAHILAAGKAPVLVIGASRAVDGLSALRSWSYVRSGSVDRYGMVWVHRGCISPISGHLC